MFWAAIAVLLSVGGVHAAEGAAAPSPAAQRGWIVVVRQDGGATSGRITEELPGKYATHEFASPSGLRVEVFDNLRFVVSDGQQQWSFLASRIYQAVFVGLGVWLAYLDPPPNDLTEAHALDLVLAYQSFGFGQTTFVLFCPPRAKVTWEGEFSTQPIIQGECRTNGKVTIALDDRAPVIIPGKLIRVEQVTGRILVDRTQNPG